MEKRWYIVHAYSNFERKVAEAIKDRAKAAGLSELFEEVLVPTEDVVEVRRGRKVQAERKFFPGYVLVKMAHDGRGLPPDQEHAEGDGLPGCRQQGDADHEDEAKRILYQVKEGVERPKPMITFEVGEKVRVADGPFASFEGQVEEVDEERSRIKVGGVDLRPADAGRAGVRAGREGGLTQGGGASLGEKVGKHGEEDRRLHQSAGARGPGEPVAADRPGAGPARPQHHGVLQAVQRQEQGHGGWRADPSEDHGVLRPFLHLRDAHAAGVLPLKKIAKVGSGSKEAGRTRARQR